MEYQEQRSFDTQHGKRRPDFSFPKKKMNLELKLDKSEYKSGQKKKDAWLLKHKGIRTEVISSKYYDPSKESVKTVSSIIGVTEDESS